MNYQTDSSRRLEITLLGKFAVIYHGELVPELNTPRLQSLLAYLALHSDATQSRKALAFRLWPESNEEQALTNLRKQVKFLRDALPDADQLLVGDRQTIGWVDPSALYCDVTEFRKRLSTSTTSNHSIATLKRALELYQGELLPGCYDEWLLPLREETQQLYLAALERFSTLHEGERNYSDAIQANLQLLRIDPLHEATYRRLIRLYALN
ncbi:MAG: BTAD domain-containing putative transcriptional regulator, partial [Caldilineaceae bacterium]